MNRKLEIIKAKPCHCVPAVLETILRYYGTCLTQEEIGRQLHVNCDETTAEES